MATNNWESHCMELEREVAELRGKVRELEKPKASNKGKLSREVIATEVFPCIMVKEDNLVDLVKDFGVEVAACMRGEDLIINIYNPGDNCIMSVAIGDIVYLKNGNVRKYLENDGFFSFFGTEGEE